MAQLPDLKTHAELVDVAYLVDGSRSVQAKDVTAASGQLSALTPNHRHPMGTVLGFRTSTSKYELADSGNVDVNQPALVAALETADADWQSSIITVSVNGVVASAVTLGAGDNTDALVVTALNADAGFAAVALASAVGGVVQIQLLGLGDLLHVNSDLATAYGAAGIDAVSTYAAYRVATAFYDLKDIDGVAIDALVPVLEAGHFDASELSSLTNDARVALLHRGSKFS